MVSNPDGNSEDSELLESLHYFFLAVTARRLLVGVLGHGAFEMPSQLFSAAPTNIMLPEGLCGIWSATPSYTIERG
jgi:hypothetical protein